MRKTSRQSSVAERPSPGCTSVNRLRTHSNGFFRDRDASIDPPIDFGIGLQEEDVKKKTVDASMSNTGR
jgi:hypothetical protein